MIELLHIDCMEYMATCKDKQFDLAVVDPPYGIFGGGGVKATHLGGLKKKPQMVNGLLNMVAKQVNGILHLNNIFLMN